MGILLTILKFIGIFLLILLGIVLFVLLVLLLAPICYKGNISYYEEQLAADGQFSFLGFVFHGKFAFQWDMPIRYSVKILWFTLIADTKNEKAIKADIQRAVHKVSEDTVQTEEAIGEKDIEDDIGEDNTSKDTIEDDFSENFSSQKKIDNLEDNRKKLAQEAEEHSSKKKKKKFILSDFWARIKNKCRLFWLNCKKTYYRFLEVKEKFRLLKKLWEAETTQRAITNCKKQLRFLLRHLKPKQLQGMLHYGFRDPATTGEVLGIISMFYPVIGPHFQIQPDFEQPCFEGEAHIKGHIRLVFFAITALRIVLDKYIKKTIKRFQRITGGN